MPPLNGGCSTLSHKCFIVHCLWHLQQPLERDVAIFPSGLIFKTSGSECLSEVGSDSSELPGGWDGCSLREDTVVGH